MEGQKSAFKWIFDHGMPPALTKQLSDIFMIFKEQEEAVHPAHDQEKTAAALRVLVVDDELSMREYAVAALNYGNYDAVAVENGSVAAAALKNEHYDLVLTDFNMPNGNGVDLIVKMRSEGFNTPVIMMTGAELTKETLAIISMIHVESVLQKPFGIEDLLNAVNSILMPANADTVDLAHNLSSDLREKEAFYR